MEVLKPYLPIRNGSVTLATMLLMPIVIVLSALYFFWPRGYLVTVFSIVLSSMGYVVFLVVLWLAYKDPIAFVREYWNRNVIGYVARMHLCEDREVKAEIWSNTSYSLLIASLPPSPCTCHGSCEHRCEGTGCWMFRIEISGWRKVFGGFFPSGNGHGVIPEEAFSSGTRPSGTMDGWKFQVVRRREWVFVRITDPIGLSRELELHFVVKLFTPLLFHFGSDIRSWAVVDNHLSFVAQWHRDAQGKMMRWSDELIGLLQEIDGTTRLVRSKEGEMVRLRLWEILSQFSHDSRIKALRESPVKPARERRKRTPEYDPAAPTITA